MNFPLGSTLVILIAIASILTLSLRFKYLAKLFNMNLSYPQALNITSLGLILNVLLPFKLGAIFGKPFLIKIFHEAGIVSSAIFSSFEMLIDMSWQLILLFVSIFILGTSYLPYNPTMQAFFFLIVIVFIFLGIRNLPFLIMAVLKKEKVLSLLPKKLREKVKSVDLNAILGMMHLQFSKPQTILFIFGTTFLHILIAPFSLGVSLQMFNITMGYVTFFGIFWLSAILGRISMLPGGIAAREASIVGLLYLQGIPPSVGVPVAVLARILALIGTAIVAVPGFISLLQKVKDIRLLLCKINLRK